MLACAYPALDRPMILFQNVVEILHRSMPAILLQSLLGFEPHDGRWITGVLVGVDDPRRPAVNRRMTFARRTIPAFIVREAAIFSSSRRSCGANLNLLADTQQT